MPFQQGVFDLGKQCVITVLLILISIKYNGFGHYFAKLSSYIELVYNYIIEALCYVLYLALTARIYLQIVIIIYNESAAMQIIIFYC